MIRLPRITGREVVAVTPTAADVVPVHSGETIGPGLLVAILRDCEIERGDFIALL